MQPQYDLRLYLTDRDLTLLNKSNDLIAIFSGANETVKQNILASGTYDGRPLDYYIGALINFSALVDPANNPFHTEYRKAFQKNFRGYNPMRRTNWVEAAHPLELFFYRCSDKVHPDVHEKLKLVINNNSPVNDPYEAERKKYQQEYQQAVEKQAEAAEVAAITAIGNKVASKPEPTPQEKEEKAEETAEELEEMEKIEKAFLFMKNNPKLSDSERISLLESLGIFEEEDIDILFKNPTLLALPSHTDKEQLKQWRKSLTSEIKKIKEKHPAQKLEPPKPAVTPPPSNTTPKVQLPVTPTGIKKPKPTPISDLRSVGNAARNFFKKSQTTVPKTPQAPAPHPEPLVPPIITAQKASNQLQKTVTTGAEIVGSKIREIVRKHPTSTTTIATGVASGLLGLVFRVPFPIGFLGGATAAQAVIRVASKGNGISEAESIEQISVSQQDPTSQSPTNQPGGVSAVTGSLRQASLLSKFMKINPITRMLLLTFGLLIGFTLLFVLAYQFSTFPPYQRFDIQGPGATEQNIKLVKTGPISIEKYNPGDRITYTISVTYTGSGIGSAEITDTLPANTRYISSSPDGTPSANTVRWRLTNLLPNSTQTISLEIEATDEIADSWVVNNVSGTASSSGGGSAVGGACPTREEIAENRRDRNSCKPLNPAIPLFSSSVSEQQVQAYIEKYQPNSSHSLAEFERRTRLIVEKAAQTGINPVLIMGLWRTESGFGTSLGCDPWGGGFPTFEDQVECAVGLRKGGAVATQCAVSKDANSPACRLAAGIQASHPDVYEGEYKAIIPISTFDDFNKLYGPFSPNLSRTEGVLNNNCIATYNTLIEVALDINACVPGGTSTDSTATGALASCKFYRPDQKPGSDLCVPEAEGFRCEEGLTYKSGYLLNIFEEAAQKSGIPATVLAAVARFESTVPLSVSATGKSYTLLDYTDEDIRAMEQFSNQVTANTIDQTINNTSKAFCPRSRTGALGIVQVQPPDRLINQFEQRNILRLPSEGAAQNSANAATARSADDTNGLNIGAKFISPNLTADQLTLAHFCNPRTALLLGAGVMRSKMGGWNLPSDEAAQEQYIKQLGARYYGMDAETSQYIEGLWQSVRQCKPSS